MRSYCWPPWALLKSNSEHTAQQVDLVCAHWNAIACGAALLVPMSDHADYVVPYVLSVSAFDRTCQDALLLFHSQHPAQELFAHARPPLQAYCSADEITCATFYIGCVAA
eukprot:gnl/TRDRNA2_/TRDRNA2_171693_c2_seq2.p1 gnl/TRDRNA2_/TRDRNA2_171693_c2~~gnl/TRDRNA2_/TRDRNA2_171693_c2_seq2.p1  ORF type:complete len:110 (-),score=5.31 gnl/TRDRNA2_/TRDRNA2_171693_c2_seq2:105-434(-)